MSPIFWFSMSVMAYFFKFFFKLFIFCTLIGLISFAGAYIYFSPKLPDVNNLKNIRLQTPLRVYSKDGKLISEFGEKHRTPINFDDIPQQFVQALISAEDSRFFDHPGIDIKGLSRAALQLAITGEIQSGGSTITMQVARNFFLTSERTFTRKFMEILLAFQIEQELSKQEIFQLYINKIYLGHRAYGIQAAANVYYGKDIKDLTLAQLAMIAGLPKAPSAYNPITNPKRAVERRNWILQRMYELNFIDQSALQQALNAEVTAHYHTSDIELRAFYVAEMVRKELYDRYGENAYTDGYRVFTTIDTRLQKVANISVTDGLVAYTERHGYLGAEAHWDMENQSIESLQQKLNTIPSYATLIPALVTAVEDKQASLLLKNGEQATLAWQGISWARPYKTPSYKGKAPTKASDVLQIGDLIRVRKDEKDQLYLTQIPKTEGALVALNPNNGAIISLVGGFNFSLSKFNRVTQAVRQPGSNIKPFIYAAAIDKGFTAASLINDTPIVMLSDDLETNWRPENANRTFGGPTRLRVALYRSRNLVSIRVLRAIGIEAAHAFLELAGFDRSKLPSNLSLALGSADVTPLQLISSYSIFANGGYRVTPFFIQRIEDSLGNVIFEAEPDEVCHACSSGNEPNSVKHPAPRVYDEKVAFLTYSMMQDVIRRGTGHKASVLNRSDIAGKTGTTNEQKDAWFSGFNRDYVVTTWVGFDQPRTLGRGEYGGVAALPIWINYMREALKDSPENAPSPPKGIISVKIDPESGKLAYPGQSNAIYEFFRAGKAPSTHTPPASLNDANTTEDIF